VSLDTYRDLYGRLLLRVPMASALLAQDWVRNAFRRVAEKRLWSWLVGYGQMIFQAQLATGTVTVTFNSNQVTGNATAAATWSAAVIGRQFRLGTNTPIYDITAVSTAVNPNDTLTLGAAWGGTTQAAVGYQIYNAYQTMPSDFFSFQTVVDPQMNWQLWANRWQQIDLNSWDAQRAAAGNPYAVVFRDYDPTTITSPPSPRYEAWPHQKSQYVLPFLYIKRATDLSDSGATLPRYIRGDVLVEGALSDAARWPGPDVSTKSPYFSPQLARDHDLRFEAMVAELERQDDEVFEQDLTYQLYTSGLPWAPFPGDARFWQSHLLPAGTVT
jgi:hypothetical protein